MKKHFYTDEIINICDNNHLTVDEIFELVAKKFPTAWKSSIYRNVEELSTKWQLKKIVWAWKKTYFEKRKNNHVHLIGIDSWNIIDFETDLIWNLKLPEWFEINDFDIKIFGRFKK
jgi:Fe2+ or Zn2+ uptake regulation protein